jgi:hypothetical protein
MRAICAGRRARLIAALARHASGIRLTGLAAGFHAVATFRGCCSCCSPACSGCPGLVCGADQRLYVTNLSRQAMEVIAALAGRPPTGI